MTALTIVLLGALVAGCAGAGGEAAAGAAAGAAEAGEKGKRQTQGEVVVAAPAHYVFRAPRRQHQYEQVAAVHEQQEEGAEETARIPVREDYRPGQVFSIDSRELLELQPERKASYIDQQQLQRVYQDPQSQRVYQDHQLQRVYQDPQSQRVYQDPQSQQVALQPSHAVIVRPSSSASGGEVHLGAALSVSDAGTNAEALDFDRELLALLGHSPENVRAAPPQEQPFQPMYTSVPSGQKLISVPYPQAERYNPKPLSKSKNVKSRPKAQPTQPPPQQYLIETTNPQQVRQVQAQRPAQSLRYVAIQPQYYERPEGQALKIIPAPKFQPARQQLAYRYIPQPQSEGTAQKQHRMYQEAKQEAKSRPEQVRYAPSVERPVTYLKRYQAPKQTEESVERYLNLQQQPQLVGEQYYIRPVYRANEQRGRYELAHLALGSTDAARALEPQQRPAHSAIYVSKNTAPKKTPATPRPTPAVNVEQHGQSLEEQRARLPPPRNNKAYTPEEFEALVAAGYSVTPVPVHDVSAQAQARSGSEPAPVRERRPQYGRRAPQYLPFRGDDAP